MTMNLSKISKNRYRIREMVNGKTVSAYFDHKPTQKEIKEVLYGIKSRDKPFIEYAEEYLQTKENVLSPSTVRGYNSIIRNLGDFGLLPFDSVTNEDLQLFINQYSVNHSPKSTNNLHGFISSVFRFYMPDRIFYTTLPKRTHTEPYIPSESDIKQIMAYVTENCPQFYVPFTLGIYGLRRGEICAITSDDITGNQLTISKSMVQNKEFEWIVKQSPKTKAGFRTILIPTEIAEEIKQNGYAFIGCPDNLTQRLHRIQKKLGIEQFSFHKLRHYYCSVAHSLGVPDVYISQTVGHEHISTTQNIYVHADKKRIIEMQNRVSDYLLGQISSN